MRNKIILVCVLSITVAVFAMIRQQGKTEEELGVKEEGTTVHEEELIGEAAEHLALLNKIIDDLEKYVRLNAPERIERLRGLAQSAEQMDQGTVQGLLMELYSFGNELRKLRDRVVIVKESLDQMPKFKEKISLFSKLQLLQQQSYIYLKQLEELLSLVTFKIPKAIIANLSQLIFYLESLSFADKIENAVQAMDIDTKRVELSGEFTADIGIFEHEKLLRGARQRAIAERVPTIPEGATLQDLQQILGEGALKELVSDYKIHLMPKDSDLQQVAMMLLNAIKHNSELQELIGLIKIKALKESFVELKIKEGKDLPFPISEKEKIPKIVIYVGGGKERAQRVLNIMYDLFKGVEGVGRAPAFNERVTSLLYFAQGNRDDKIKYPHFFDEDLIYYKPDITGMHEDYHLINPALSK